MKRVLFVVFIMSMFMVACQKDDSSKGEIKISPLGSRILSDISIRKVDKIEDNTIHFSGGNYATETTILSSTTYEVDPGRYYVYLRYKNTSSGSLGWWQTTSDNLITVAAGETWKITYGYSGGSITKQ